MDLIYIHTTNMTSCCHIINSQKKVAMWPRDYITSLTKRSKWPRKLTSWPHQTASDVIYILIFNTSESNFCQTVKYNYLIPDLSPHSFQRPFFFLNKKIKQTDLVLKIWINHSKSWRHGFWLNSVWWFSVISRLYTCILFLKNLTNCN